MCWNNRLKDLGWSTLTKSATKQKPIWSIKSRLSWSKRFSSKCSCNPYNRTHMKRACHFCTTPSFKGHNPKSWSAKVQNLRWRGSILKHTRKASNGISKGKPKWLLWESLKKTQSLRSALSDQCAFRRSPSERRALSLMSICQSLILSDPSPKADSSRQGTYPPQAPKYTPITTSLCQLPPVDMTCWTQFWKPASQGT